MTGFDDRGDCVETFDCQSAVLPTENSYDGRAEFVWTVFEAGVL